MIAANKWADLAGKFPDAGKQSGKGLDVKKDADAIVRELTEGGVEAVTGVIAGLVPREKNEDSKLRHALHALVIHVTSLKEEIPKRLVAKGITEGLAGDHPKEVKAFLLRQLPFVMGRGVVLPVSRLLEDDELCDPAAQALLAFGSRAAPAFLKALATAKGKRVAVLVQALGLLRYRAAVPELQKLVKDEDRDVRLTAAWALANIPDALGIEPILEAGKLSSTLYERSKVISAGLLLAERIAEVGKPEVGITVYRTLERLAGGDDFAHAREAIERGLAKLKG